MNHNQPRKMLFKVIRTEEESSSLPIQLSSSSSLNALDDNNSNMHTSIGFDVNHNHSNGEQEAKAKSKTKTKDKAKAQPKYLCSLCDKNCHNKVNYKHHMNKHNRHEFQCPTCKVICNDKPELATHMRSNHFFPCSDCPKAFSTKDEYNTHIQSHFITKFLIEFIETMCRNTVIVQPNQIANQTRLSLRGNRHCNPTRIQILIKQRRRRLMNKHQQVRECNHYDNDDYSTDNDE